MPYHLLFIFSFCISTLVHASECLFSRYNGNDFSTKNTLWTITFSEDVGKKFEFYNNYLSECPSETNVFYGLTKHELPSVTKSTAQKLFDIAKKPEQADRLVTSPWELELLVRVANKLEAKKEINAALLGTKHAHEFIQELFMPQPKSWRTWFKYRLQSMEGIEDLQSYVTETIAQSPELTKNYKSFFYTLLYECPEWKKVDTELPKIKSTEKTVTIMRRNDQQEVVLKYYPFESVKSCLEQWKKSRAFQTYAELYCEDRLNDMYESNLEQYKNAQDTLTYLYERGYCSPLQKFYNCELSISIKTYANKLHLPFQLHFIKHGLLLLKMTFPDYLYVRDANHPSLNEDEESPKCKIPVVFEPLDIRLLKVHFGMKNVAGIDCLIDPASLPAIQSYNWKSEDNTIFVFHGVGKSFIDLFQKKFTTYKTECGLTAIGPQWQLKIIEPWSVLLSLLGTMGIISKYSYSQYIKWDNDLYQAYLLKVIDGINNMNIPQTHYNLLASIGHLFSTQLDSNLWNHIESKSMPQDTYTISTIYNTYSTHEKIVSLADSLSIGYIRTGIYGIWIAGTLGLFVCALYLYNVPYKKYRPAAALYNPLKIFFPFEFGKDSDGYYNEDHLPRAYPFFKE